MADTTFTVKVTMGERWVPQFLGLLREMQRNGGVGHSAVLAFYADGDGDYRPRFEWDTDIGPADGYRDDGNVRHPEVFYDAG